MGKLVLYQMVTVHVSMRAAAELTTWGTSWHYTNILWCSGDWWQVSDLRMPDPSVSYSGSFNGHLSKKSFHGNWETTEIYPDMLPPFWQSSDPNSQSIPCQKPSSRRQAGSKDSSNAVVGRYMTMENFPQPISSFSWPLSLKYSDLP